MLDFNNSINLTEDTTREYEILKNNIFLLNNKSAYKSIVIGNSVHKEGGSSIARNLSHAFAKDTNSKVLLFDLNFRSPSHYYDDIQLKGVSNYCLENIELDSVINKTAFENLFLLTTGSARCDPLSLMKSGKFSELMEIVKENYFYIIMDLPPFQYYPESLLLASKVDGVILVVQADKTRREIVMDTKEKLESAHANILGIIMNRKKHYIPGLIYSRL